MLIAEKRDGEINDLILTKSIATLTEQHCSLYIYNNQAITWWNSTVTNGKHNKYLVFQIASI